MSIKLGKKIVVTRRLTARIVAPATAMVIFLLTGCALVREGRAVWVVRNSLVDPTAAPRIVSDAENNNLNTLFVQVRGRGDAYYSSGMEPRSEALDGLPAQYDPLQAVLDAGHAKRLKVHAWVNAYYAWDLTSTAPRSSRHVVNRRPDWLITDDEERRINNYTREELANKWAEGLYLDPAAEGVRDYLVEVFAEVVRKYPVEGVHLDFIRYPGVDFGFNPDLRGEFVERFGVDPLLLSEKARYLRPDPSIWLSGDASLLDRWNHYYYAMWNAEKARSISDTVRQAYEAVKRVRKGVVVSAAVIPDPEKAYYQFSQDWRRWLREGYLDMVVPMAYYGDIERIRSQVRTAVAVAGRDRVYVGLGAWTKDSKAISKEIEMLRDEGVSGFSLFSYGGMLEKGSYLRDLKQSAMPMGLWLPRMRGRGSQRGAEVLAKEKGPGWLNEGYQWSAVSAEQTVRAAMRVEEKRKGVRTEQSMFQVALSEGIRASEAEVTDYIEALSGEFPTREDFVRAQEKLNLNLLELKRFIEQEIILYKYVTRNLYPATIPAPWNKLSVPASADISYILRTVHPKDGEERRAAAKKIMEEVLQKLDAGEDFARLAKEYSQGGNAAYGGRAGTIYYRPGEKISDAVFPLKEGQHSRVIEAHSGYYIYKINGLRPPFQAEYQSLPWKLKRQLLEERLTKSIKNWGAETKR